MKEKRKQGRPKKKKIPNDSIDNNPNNLVPIKTNEIDMTITNIKPEENYDIFISFNNFRVFTKWLNVIKSTNKMTLIFKPKSGLWFEFVDDNIKIFSYFDASKFNKFYVKEEKPIEINCDHLHRLFKANKSCDEIQFKFNSDIKKNIFMIQFNYKNGAAEQNNECPYTIPEKIDITEKINFNVITKINAKLFYTLINTLHKIGAKKLDIIIPIDNNFIDIKTKNNSNAKFKQSELVKFIKKNNTNPIYHEINTSIINMFDKCKNFSTDVKIYLDGEKYIVFEHDIEHIGLMQLFISV